MQMCDQGDCYAELVSQLLSTLSGHDQSYLLPTAELNLFKDMAYCFDGSKRISILMQHPLSHVFAEPCSRRFSRGLLHLTCTAKAYMHQKKGLRHAV